MRLRREERDERKSRGVPEACDSPGILVLFVMEWRGKSSNIRAESSSMLIRPRDSSRMSPIAYHERILPLLSPVHHHTLYDTAIITTMAHSQNDVLATILAELRDLKASHQSLETRLDGLSLSSSSSTNPAQDGSRPASVKSSSGLAQPISISSNGHGHGHGAHSNGAASPQLSGPGAASPTLQFGSPNSPLPSGLSALHQQYGGSGNSVNTISSALGAGRKMSSTTDSAIKQDFINWARSTPPPKEAASGSASDKQIYTSRAVLTSASLHLACLFSYC